ncbi:MAG: peptide chain release factor N(5)-glutamine methyltransferase [Acidobacteria bacterium]|nr:peptide chain release factor N(5)-glutamine methyltransferase [Acidobacteriota bacterium]
MSTPATIAETLQEAARRLRGAGVPNDLLDAQTLLCHTLNRDRTWLIINYRETTQAEAHAEYVGLVERRAGGEPVQYITGKQEFFGLDFMVTPAVLIPRPESELIIEETIRIVAEAGWKTPTVVDVGTGSGCLAVVIAREVPTARVIAIDISGEALRVAQTNARLNGVEERIEFIEGDLLNPLSQNAHLIVSNPPYIASSEMATLQREVREWEPRLALTDEFDGLSHHRRLIDTAPEKLKVGGYLICEMGYQQAGPIRQIFDQGAPNVWDGPRLLTDLQGIERTFVARLRERPLKAG